MKNESIIIFSFIVLFLFSNFSVGDDRVNPFRDYAYAYLAIYSMFLSVLCVVKRKTKVRVTSVFILFLFLNVMIILLGLFNNMGLYSFVEPATQLLIYIFFICLFELSGFSVEEFIFVFLKFVCLITLLSLIFAFYGFIFGDFSFGPFEYISPMKFEFRLKGWYNSANYFGPALCIGIYTCIYMLLNRNNFNIHVFNKILLFLLLFFSVLGLVLTGSKGSILALIAGVSVFFLIQRRPVRKGVFHNLKFLILLSIVCVLGFYLLSEFGYDHEFIINEIIRVDGIKSNIEGGDRMYFVKSAMRMVAESNVNQFLLGYGPEAFVNKIGYSTHNGFLGILISRGVIVFILLVFLIVSVFISTAKMKLNNNFSAFLFGLLVIIFVKNFTNSEIFTINFSGIVFVYILSILSMRKVVV